MLGFLDSWRLLSVDSTMYGYTGACRMQAWLQCASTDGRGEGKERQTGRRGEGIGGCCASYE